jgi:hypothetical protein
LSVSGKLAERTGKAEILDNVCACHHGSVALALDWGLNSTRASLITTVTAS